MECKCKFECEFAEFECESSAWHNVICIFTYPGANFTTVQQFKYMEQLSLAVLNPENK